MIEFKEKNLKKAIEKQLRINGIKGITMEFLKEIDNWYTYFETNNHLENKYKKWLRRYFKKFVPKEQIENEIGWFLLGYGFKNIDNCR